MNHRKIIVAPSLLAADVGQLREEAKSVELAGADWHHVDVMDAHFVPNLSFSPSHQASLKDSTNLDLDTHLMMTHPSAYIDSFHEAGSNWITIHVESSEDVSENLKKIRALGMKSGISLKPGTPVESLEPYLASVDLVLVMTVEPGFGGQSFMVDMVKKITYLADLRQNEKRDFLIEVDGGINALTGRICSEAGADVLVAGSFIYSSKDRKVAIDQLRNFEL